MSSYRRGPMPVGWMHRGSLEMSQTMRHCILCSTDFQTTSRSAIYCTVCKTNRKDDVIASKKARRKT